MLGRAGLMAVAAAVARSAPLPGRGRGLGTRLHVRAARSCAGIGLPTFPFTCRPGSRRDLSQAAPARRAPGGCGAGSSWCPGARRFRLRFAARLGEARGAGRADWSGTPSPGSAGAPGGEKTRGTWEKGEDCCERDCEDTRGARRSWSGAAAGAAEPRTASTWGQGRRPGEREEGRSAEGKRRNVGADQRPSGREAAVGEPLPRQRCFQPPSACPSGVLLASRVPLLAPKFFGRHRSPPGAAAGAATSTRPSSARRGSPILRGSLRPHPAARSLMTRARNAATVWERACRALQAERPLSRLHPTPNTPSGPQGPQAALTGKGIETAAGRKVQV